MWSDDEQVDEEGEKQLEEVHQQTSTGGGALYVRWGRSECPLGRETVYNGQAASKHYSHVGGGNNYQCFPRDPEYSDFRPGPQRFSFVYGVEYEAPISQLGGGSTNLHDQNVPCAVCRVAQRATALMIPAKITCPQGWTKEYEGYLMTAHYRYHSQTFECVDRDAEAAPGGHGNTNGGLFYHVESSCHTNLRCPPYDRNKELTCVVCTK